MIARRADTKARADFATWKMMTKLNGTSSLPAEALAFLSSYGNLLEKMPEAEASEATIVLIYNDYYAEMGGTGTPPDIKSVPKDPIVELDNVTAFRRPEAQQPQTRNSGAKAKPRLPVALIFTLLIVIYVGIRYYFLR
ncbi:MAG: hypothetical protein NTAFB05_15730 [Nitrobacter sp.]